MNIIDDKTMNQPFTYDSVHLRPCEQIDLHQDSSWELSYVIIGAGTRLIGDTTEIFHSGEVILIPPEIPHCWYFDNQVTDTQGKIANITVHFQSQWLDLISLAFPLLNNHITRLLERQDAVKFTHQRAARIIRLLETMRDLSAEHRIAHMIELILAISETEDEFIVGKRRKHDRRQERIDQIRVFIICNSQKSITIDDTARHLNMNRSAFCSFFKRTTGKTFVNYLNELRVEQACQLLKQHRMSISEICFHVGFNNIPYFNRVFKRLKGMSPTQYIFHTLQDI